MKYKNVAFLLGSLGLSLSFILPAKATFSFSDFSFFRHNDPQTDFHTTNYVNEDGSAAGQGIAAFNQFVHKESSAIDLDELNARRLDGTKLQMVTDIDDLKIYFIHEGAGYKNQLKLTMTGGTYEEGLVFVDGSQGGGSNQLRKGDYVNVGDVAAGTTLDFALLANGYGRTNFHTYYADIDRNPDGLQHVMAYDYQGYLILAWEDLYNGGDKDYNDIVFAVDIGETNLERIPSDPVVNRPPAAAEDQAITPYETEILIDVMANDTDPDQDSISITDVDGFLSSGTVQIQGDKVLYTPEDDYYGTDTFTYTIEDIHGGTNSATVTVEVEKIAAEATDDSLRTPEDVLGTLNVLDNDSTSSDNSTLTVIKVNDEESKVGTEITLTSGAKVKIESDGELTYDPNGSFNSLLDGDVDSDSFSYSIDDGKGGESTATVNVTIQGVTGNTDPNAIDDEIEFPSNKNKNIFVLDNDVDPDGDSLKIVQIGSQNALYEADGNPKTAKYTLPSGGKVKLIKITKEGKNQGKHVIRYFPSEDHKKITTETTDTFTYSIEDGKNGLDTATVQVTIQPTVFAD